MTILWAIKHAVCITLFILSDQNSLVTFSPLPPSLKTGRCLVVRVDKLFVNFWFAPLAYEGFIFILLLVKFYQTKLDTRMSNARLLIVFVRDGAWAFIIASVSLAWCALDVQLNQGKSISAITWLFAFFGTLACRLVLNLRTVARRRSMEPTNVGRVDALCPEMTVTGCFPPTAHILTRQYEASEGRCLCSGEGLSTVP